MSMTMQGQAERGFGQSLAYGWARLYTKGMTEGRREHRLQQIESDLFEHTADRTEGGASPSLVGFETLERFLRGIPADILWRFQMEGINMRIRIPVERVVGGILLSLVVLIMIATSISGYDTARAGWEGELARLSELPNYQVAGNMLFQSFAGLSLIVLAAVLYAALRGRSAILSTFCGFSFAAAGVLTFVASALYGVVATLADETSTGLGGANILVTSRAFALAMDDVVRAGGLLSLSGIYVLATIAFRERLVPRRLLGLAVMSGGLVFAAWIVEVVADKPDWNWGVFMSGAALAMLWLIVAGGWMVLGNAAHSLGGGHDDAAAHPV